MHSSASALATQDNTKLAAALSPIMFGVGDRVEAKSPSLHFVMSVNFVNPRTGFCSCVFGFSGRDAGNFHHTELKFYGGDEIDAALAS
jgi:hypothetical protein